MHAKASDAYEHILDSAGALAFGNEYAESAASPALYNAFAERKPACPLAQRDHMPRDPPCSNKSPQYLRPLLASIGLMRNTMSASKPPALRDERLGSLSTALQPSMCGAQPCVRGATDNPLPCALSAIKGPLCLHCANRISSCSFR